MYPRRTLSVAGKSWKENDLIFTSTIGTPSHPDNVYHVFNKFRKDLGLEEIRFHDLRDPGTIHLLKQGTHPKIVQERSGPADIA